MSIAQVIQKLYGTYIPTGVYSFEFITKRGKSITEIVLMLPPESVTVSEGQRAELVPTIGGGYLCDYGNDFKDITLSGSLHFYYVGTKGNPIAFRAEAGDDLAIDGYKEFIKLRYMLSRYRDYTLTPKAKRRGPDMSGANTADVQALKEHVENNSNNLAPNIELIFHDYDYDEHFKVKVDKFSVSRDKSDPFTIKYDIALKAYEVFNKSSAQKTEVKQTAVESLSSSSSLMSTLHPESYPTSVPSSSPNDLVLPAPASQQASAVATVLQDNEIYAYNERLRVYRAYLLWAIGMIQSGVMDVASALKGFPTNADMKEFRDKLL